jgi:hypothetical protein
MLRQAEAERERRARIISADGEYQASKKLDQAAAVMAADPAALQLRLLQTVVEVAAEKNTTLLMPVPVELLRFFDRAALPPARLSRRLTEATPVPTAAERGGNRQRRVTGAAVNRHCPDRTSAAFGVMFMVKLANEPLGLDPALLPKQEGAP